MTTSSYQPSFRTSLIHVQVYIPDPSTVTLVKILLPSKNCHICAFIYKKKDNLYTFYYIPISDLTFSPSRKNFQSTSTYFYQHSHKLELYAKVKIRYPRGSHQYALFSVLLFCKHTTWLFTIYLYDL